MDVVVFLAAWLGLWWWGARRRAVDTGGMAWRRTWVGVLAFFAAGMATAGVATGLYGFAIAMLGFGGVLIYALRAQGDRWRGLPHPVWATPEWMKPRPPTLPKSPGTSLVERLRAAYDKCMAEMAARRHAEVEKRRAEMAAKQAREASAKVEHETVALRKLGSSSRATQLARVEPKSTYGTEAYLDPDDFGLDDDELEMLGSASRPLLHFIYEDANGNQSIRTVSHWKKDGPYIHGFCYDALGVRTFRKTRVLEWLDGTEDYV